MADADTHWTAEHLVGGHPALDLTNTVFDRIAPTADNELLKSPRDVAKWLRITGLIDPRQAADVDTCSRQRLLQAVYDVREATYVVFSGVAGGQEPAPGSLAPLMAAAAESLHHGDVTLREQVPILLGRCEQPRVVAGFLALLSVNAYFTVPGERIRSCPRCGWLFLDTSRGGARRWCSMKTCGNRDKVARHRARPTSRHG